MTLLQRYGDVESTSQIECARSQLNDILAGLGTDARGSSATSKFYIYCNSALITKHARRTPNGSSKCFDTFGISGTGPTAADYAHLTITILVYPEVQLPVELSLYSHFLLDLLHVELQDI